MPKGESPLVRSKKFHDVKCPKCGSKARRESDTMDTFVCSSWYYFRYADPKNEKEFASKERIKKWLPVDLYVGGAEHTVLHLLYSRFFTKVLHNLGYIGFDEPFLKLRHQGIILAEDGRKMSKSLGNVISPDDVVAKYGADSLRLFEMFMGPLEDAKQWNTKGITGTYRFLDKIWKFIESQKMEGSESFDHWKYNKASGDTSPEIKKVLHESIKKITSDIEELKFNTAISQLMIFINSFYKRIDYEIPKGAIGGLSWEATTNYISVKDFEIFLKLLAPFASHIAEEIWQNKELLNHKASIFKEKWPEPDKKFLKEEKITLIIQINGKVRDKIEVVADISEKEAKELAFSSEKIKKWTAGKEIKKAIFVPGKLINLVA
jgi:leucyl-tRNA synthetase